MSAMCELCALRVGEIEWKQQIFSNGIQKGYVFTLYTEQQQGFHVFLQTTVNESTDGSRRLKG